MRHTQAGRRPQPCRYLGRDPLRHWCGGSRGPRHKSNSYSGMAATTSGNTAWRVLAFAAAGICSPFRSTSPKQVIRHGAGEQPGSGEPIEPFSSPKAPTSVLARAQPAEAHRRPRETGDLGFTRRIGVVGGVRCGDDAGRCSARWVQKWVFAGDSPSSRAGRGELFGTDERLAHKQAGCRTRRASRASGPAGCEGHGSRPVLTQARRSAPQVASV